WNPAFRASGQGRSGSPGTSPGACGGAAGMVQSGRNHPYEKQLRRSHRAAACRAGPPLLTRPRDPTTAQRQDSPHIGCSEVNVMASDADPSRLSADDRRAVASWTAEFTQSWDESALTGSVR